MIAIFIAAVSVCAPADAGFFTGSITASFQDPVLIGSTSNPSEFFDNTNSAVYSSYGLDGAAVFQWGSDAASGPGYSSLIFFPNQNVNVNSGQSFDFGSITYFNGTSELNSLVFGVDLVLHFSGSPAVDDLTIPIAIGTTGNTSDAHTSADYVSFGGFNVIFSVLEGFGATAKLTGSIVGDPMFVPQSVVLQPTITVYTGPTDQSPALDLSQYLTLDIGIPGGFLGSPVPEPSTFALAGVGCIGLAVGAYRRRRIVA